MPMGCKKALSPRCASLTVVIFDPISYRMEIMYLSPTFYIVTRSYEKYCCLIFLLSLNTALRTNAPCKASFSLLSFGQAHNLLVSPCLSFKLRILHLPNFPSTSSTSRIFIDYTIRQVLPFNGFLVLFPTFSSKALLLMKSSSILCV